MLRNRQVLVWIIPLYLVTTVSVSLAAEEVIVPIKAFDPHRNVVPNLVLTYRAVETQPTTDAGVTELLIVPREGQELAPGTAIRLGLPASMGATWFLIDATVHIPGPGADPAEVAVMKHEEFRRLARDVRDAQLASRQRQELQLTAEERRQTLLDYAQDHGLSESELEAAIKSFKDAARDAMDEGIALYLEEEYGQAEPFFREALENAELNKARGEQIVSQAEENIVEAASYLGKTLRAQYKYEEALAVYRDAPINVENNAPLLKELGDVLMMLGQWEEAELAYRRVLEITESRHGQTHPETIRALRNLAWSLLQTTEKLGEAEGIIRRALAISEAHYGHDNPRIASDLNHLARLLRKTNRLNEAIRLMRRVVKLVEQGHGPKSLAVSIMLINLATTYQGQGRLEKAESMMRRALEIDKTKMPLNHPMTAMHITSFALILRDAGKYDEAEKYLRQALAINVSTLGPDHSAVGSSLTNLASVLFFTDRLDKAEQLLKRALKIHEARYGPYHPKVTVSLNTIASILMNTGRWAEAEPFLRRALTIKEATHGPAHPQIMPYLLALTRIYCQIDQVQKAKEFRRQALAMQMSTHETDSVENKMCIDRVDRYVPRLIYRKPAEDFHTGRKTGENGYL